MPDSTRSLSIEVQRTTAPRAKPTGELGFGRYLTDHTAIATHDGKSWGAPRIVPVDDPRSGIISGAIQYGLSVFEGLKAWRAPNGQVRLFRAAAHAKRFAASARALCMPAVDEEVFVETVAALVRLESEWCPKSEDGSIYVRPTILASEQYLGVRPANEHLFSVVLSPVGAYFKGDARPLRLWAEKERVRAAKGGVGGVKTGGNYAASLFAAERARARGFDQVLWLDAHHHEYLEEAGTMNVFARLGDRVFTPPAGETVLPGITRATCISLLAGWGIKVEERAPSLAELTAASLAGGEVELWGSGTAAGVAPIGEIAWDGGELKLAAPKLAARLQTTLMGIVKGTHADEHGWITAV
jgi:branched-chain amino acid aminotransferase